MALLLAPERMRLLLLLLLFLASFATAKDKPKHKMALKDNLDAYWNMEQDPSTVSIWDKSGNGHHLTSSGLDGTSNPFAQSVTGKVGKGISLSFNTVTFASSYLDLLLTLYPGLDLDSKDFTVVAWFKPSRLGNIAILGSSAVKWFAKISSSGSEYYATVKIANGSNIVITDVPLEEGQWYFLAFGWHNSPDFGQYSWATVNLSDRVRVAQGPWSNDSPAFGITGVAGGGDPFDGVVDEVGIWSRRLSASELRELYNHGDGLPFEEWDVVPECEAIPCCD